MLWHYTVILFVVALVATILSFYRGIEKLGQVFFLLIGGIMWPVVAISLLQLEFRWAGSTSVVSYTFIPASESWGLVFGLGTIGILMFLIGIVRAFELTYQPTVDNFRRIIGERDVGEMHDI